MDSGNSCSLQSSSSGDGGGVSLSPRFTPIPIHQPSSNFFNPSSFSQPPIQNPNPNSNPIYDLDSYLNPNPDSGSEKLTAKNPKKRTRASRRAPTTVLTTDTTNFRQMVQEFTGIPASPFATSSSSVFSRRSDFYGGGMSPVQPFRPSAQKIQLQQQSYLNFPITPSETHGFTKQPLNLSNLQNQMFPFQSISQINNLPRESHGLEPPSEYFESSSTPLKRWRGEDENLMNFEGVNGNSQNDVVPSSDGDQLPGNEESWTF